MLTRSFQLGDGVPDYASRNEMEPAIVFGDENKLTAEGLSSKCLSGSETTSKRPLV